jgi:hypothetical protein
MPVCVVIMVTQYRQYSLCSRTHMILTIPVFLAVTEHTSELRWKRGGSGGLENQQLRFEDQRKASLAKYHAHIL